MQRFIDPHCRYHYRSYHPYRHSPIAKTMSVCPKRSFIHAKASQETSTNSINRVTLSDTQTTDTAMLSDRLHLKKNSIVEFFHPMTMVHSVLSRFQKSRAMIQGPELNGNNTDDAPNLEMYVRDPVEVKKVDVYSVPAASCVEHPTLKVMLERKLRGSVPKKRKDLFKVGLVVEGGGMRGAVSGAMLMELQKLGFYETFDAVYGSSAGAVNGAYFLAGQPQGMEIYFDHLTSKRFIDLRRFFSPEPVLDLDFLINPIMTEVVPLDWEGVLKSKIPLKVIASSLDELKSVILEDFQSKENLITALKASCTVPEIVGPPEILYGQRLVDAAVFEPIPYKAAIQDGCTHVLALCSRSRPRGGHGKAKRAMKKIMDQAIKRFVLNPPYMKKAWRTEVEKMLNGGLDADDLMLLTMLQGLQGTPTAPIDGHILAVYPSPKYTIAPTCIDEDLLRNGAQEAKKAINRLFQPLVKSQQRVEKYWFFV